MKLQCTGVKSTEWVRCSRSRAARSVEKRQKSGRNKRTRYDGVAHLQNGTKLDTGQSPTLARPAAPLAACVQRISYTSYRTLMPPTECHRNSVLWIKTKNWFVTAASFAGSKYWANVRLIIIYSHTFSGTTQVSRYQKGKTNLDCTEARDSEWQWHQLGRMQNLHCAPDR